MVLGVVATIKQLLSDHIGVSRWLTDDVQFRTVDGDAPHRSRGQLPFGTMNQVTAAFLGRRAIPFGPGACGRSNMKHSRTSFVR